MTLTTEQIMARACDRLERERRRSSIQLARELKRIAGGAKVSLGKLEIKVYAQLVLARDDEAAATVRRIIEAARMNVERYLAKRHAGLVDRWARSASSTRMH